MTVDVYCLQHPDRYCVSAKSLAAHLTGLGWAIDHGVDGRGLGALRRALDGPVELVKPEIPRERGSLTIADVAAVSGADAYPATVDAWARSTWDAYASLHDVARTWITRAFA